MRPAAANPEDPALAAVRAQGRAAMDANGAYLERRARERARGASGRQFSVADLYLYMLTGLAVLHRGRLPARRRARASAHYERVGARPAVVRARELDDLDERQIRYHPELRAGQPI